MRQCVCDVTEKEVSEDFLDVCASAIYTENSLQFLPGRFFQKIPLFAQRNSQTLCVTNGLKEATWCFGGFWCFCAKCLLDSPLGGHSPDRSNQHIKNALERTALNQQCECRL